LALALDAELAAALEPAPASATFATALDAAAEPAAAWAAPLALALDAEFAALAAAEFAAAWAAPLALALEADLAAETDCETVLLRAAVSS
jgi:hypothetical protein